MPAGRKAPKVTAVRRVLAKAVTRRKMTMAKELVVLSIEQKLTSWRGKRAPTDSLAKAVGIDGAAVLKEVGDELGRGNPHKDDEVADHRGEER